MKTKYLFITAFVVLLTVGGYFYLQAQKLADYKVIVGAKKILQANINRIVAEITLVIENKSAIDVIVNSYDLDLTVNGNFVSRLANKIPQLIQPKGESDFKIVLDFDPKTVLRQALNLEFIQSLLKNKSNVLIGLNGSVSIMNGLKNIPINITTPLSEF